MLAADDLFYTSSSHVSSFFLEDVSSWLEASDIRYTPRVKFSGKAGYDHLFDFVIAKSKKKPERVLQVLNNPNKGAVETIIFKWNDTRALRDAGSQLYTFLNDSDKTIN